MHLSDKDRRRQRYQRRKQRATKQRRRQQERHIRQLDRNDYFAEMNEWKDYELECLLGADNE
jgi:hypothetical protein